MSALADRLRDRSARVGVVGLGYVGLPLSLSLAEAGFEVRYHDPYVPLIPRCRWWWILAAPRAGCRRATW